MSMLGRLFGFGRNEHYDQGVRLYDQGLFEDAIRELSRAPRNPPDELTDRLASFYIAESYSSLGTSALNSQQYARAREALGKALEINPHYADLNFQYGRAARGAGDLPGALAAFQTALVINPRYAKALFFYGLTLYESGQPEPGLASLQEAIALDPGFRTPQFEEALTAHQAGNEIATQVLLSRVAETDVDDITFHSRLGADLYRRGMYPEAAAEFQKALALNPSYADIRNHLGIAFNAQGLYPEAIEAFRAALALSPGYTEARANLALTLRAAGRPDEANAEFSRVLEADPDNALARDEVVR